MYKRVLLKLSGESFAKEGKGQGINQDVLHDLAQRIKEEIVDEGFELAIVVGGGNFWRYRDMKGSGIERTYSDYMGMLATILNAVALQAALRSFGVETHVMSAIDVPQLSEPYIRGKAMSHIKKGRVLICAGGTGNPYFTTDSAAALRASELNCDVLLKATNVDGVYDKDPDTNSDAVKYDTLTYDEALEKHLNIMDQAAFSLCRDQKLPIRVFNFAESGSMKKAAGGENIGTLVSE
jgi:uridylate kinase